MKATKRRQRVCKKPARDEVLKLITELLRLHCRAVKATVRSVIAR